MQKEIQVKVVDVENKQVNITISLNPARNVQQESMFLNFLKPFISLECPPLMYIIDLILSSGYFEDATAHNEIMTQFAKEYSYLLPESICELYAEKNIIRKDHEIYKLYNAIQSSITRVCFQDNGMMIAKSALLDQFLLNENDGIILIKDKDKQYCNNPFNSQKIIGHGLVLWLRQLIKQLDNNCFDYSKYVPQSMSDELGKSQSEEDQS
jgi:hypothetical protein